MAGNLRVAVSGGEGKEAENDAAYFGGYVKPANRREDRIDRRSLKTSCRKRKAVIASRARRQYAAGRVPERKRRAVHRLRIAKHGGSR